MNAAVLQSNKTVDVQELINPELALTLVARCDNPNAIYWFEHDLFILQDQSLYLYWNEGWNDWHLFCLVDEFVNRRATFIAVPEIIKISQNQMGRADH